MLFVFSARSIAVYVCTVTQYISLWADCQQVGNNSSQHLGRELGGEGRGKHTHTTTHIHTHVGLEMGRLGTA